MAFLSSPSGKRCSLGLGPQPLEYLVQPRVILQCVRDLRGEGGGLHAQLLLQDFGDQRPGRLYLALEAPVLQSAGDGHRLRGDRIRGLGALDVAGAYQTRNANKRLRLVHLGAKSRATRGRRGRRPLRATGAPLPTTASNATDSHGRSSPPASTSSREAGLPLPSPGGAPAPDGPRHLRAPGRWRP